MRKLDSIEEEMKALLYNFWITKDENPNLYYQIKNKQNAIKDFISKNLGSNLIIHDRFVKLEKIPTVIKTNNKLNKFDTVLEYVILLIILLFLEDKTRGEYFVLSDLIEYVKNTAITLELNHIPNWNNTQDRKSLTNVIRILEELNIIKVKDASKISFIESKDAEVLYESKGLSNYLMRLFDEDISELATSEDFIKNEFISQDEAKGDVRRYKVFRNILYTPAVSSKDLTANELDYIKKNRNYIKNEISKNLNMEAEITHNLVILYDEENSFEKDNFPNTKKITDIVLMINDKILQDINAGKIVLNNLEIAIISEDYFKNIIREIKINKVLYIGKTLLKENEKNFYGTILDYMQKYNIIEKNKNEIIIYPTVARLVGKTRELNINKTEQMTLLGGNNEL